MSKQKQQTNVTPSQLLQLDANKLAVQHRQRLHQMTREAVYGAAKKRPLQTAAWSLFGVEGWVVAAPVFSLTALVLIWQVVQQPETAALTPSLALKKNIPGWVKDIQVPVAVIENVEFYQWLEQELENKQKHEKKNNINT